MDEGGVGAWIGKQSIDLFLQIIQSFGVLEEELLQDEADVLDVFELLAVLAVYFVHFFLEGQLDVFFQSSGGLFSELVEDHTLAVDALFDGLQVLCVTLEDF